MIISEMGFNIKNNYGPNIEVKEGGTLNLYQSQNGQWHSEQADDAEIVEEVFLPVSCGSLIWCCLALRRSSPR